MCGLSEEEKQGLRERLEELNKLIHNAKTAAGHEDTRDAQDWLNRARWAKEDSFEDIVSGPPGCTFEEWYRTWKSLLEMLGLILLQLLTGRRITSPTGPCTPPATFGLEQFLKELETAIKNLEETLSQTRDRQVRAILGKVISLLKRLARLVQGFINKPAPGLWGRLRNLLRVIRLFIILQRLLKVYAKAKGGKLLGALLIWFLAIDEYLRFASNELQARAHGAKYLVPAQDWLAAAERAKADMERMLTD